MRFENLAGIDMEKTNAIIRAELSLAGIEMFQSRIYAPKENSEIQTDIRGILDPSGWGVQRAWRYWVADGPGLPLAVSEDIHKAFGKEVRVSGHCGCPPPAYCRGFAVGLYHVDSAEGLKYLADAIKATIKPFDG